MRILSSLAFLCLSFLVACGGPPPTNGESPDGGTPVQGRGTANDPFLLAERVRVTAPAVKDAGDVVWFRLDLEGDGPFVLLTEDLPYSVALEVYAEPNRLAPVLADCNGGPGAVVCVLDLQPGRYFVGGTYVPLLASTPYHLTYFQLDPDGRAEAPVVLEPNAAARWAGLTEDTPSYYRFEASIAGAYQIRIESPAGYIASSRIDVFANADFGTEPIESCYSTSSPRGCSLAGLRSGSYGVRVTGDWSGPQLVKASVVFGIGRGAPLERVQLANGTHAGGVDSWSMSYYSFTTDSGPSGSYSFRFDAPSPGHNLYLYSDDVEYGDLLGQCAATRNPCEIGGLDSNRTYFLNIQGGGDVDDPFTFTYGKGSFVGSQNEPALLALDTPVELQRAEPVTSFYRFRTASSGPYELRVEAMDTSVAYEPFFSVFSDIGLTTYVGNCNAIPCITSPLDAGRDYYFKVDSSAATALRLVVKRAAVGDGSAADPVPLSLGAAHATTFSDGNTSYYSFTTNASPPAAIAVFARFPAFVRWANRFEPSASITKRCDTSICIYSDLDPNTTYHFSFDNYFEDLPAVVRIIDMSGPRPCDSNAASCVTFEGAAPSTTQPSYSVDNWDLTSAIAANGTQSFVSGSGANNNERTCFGYVGPSTSTVVHFNVREITDVTNALTVMPADGEFESFLSMPVVSGSWRRAIVAAPLPDVPSTSGREWIFCYARNGNGGATDTAWVDDLQFE